MDIIITLISILNFIKMLQSSENPLKRKIWSKGMPRKLGLKLATCGAKFKAIGISTQVLFSCEDDVQGWCCCSTNLSRAQENQESPCYCHDYEWKGFWSTVVMLTFQKQEEQMGRSGKSPLFKNESGKPHLLPILVLVVGR